LTVSAGACLEMNEAKCSAKIPTTKNRMNGNGFFVGGLGVRRQQEPWKLGLRY
jgi:hypothetical protein